MTRDISDFNNNFYSAEKLYTSEKFLRALKRLNPNLDSKSIVDRATKKPVDEVLNALDNLDEFIIDDIQKFSDIFLHSPGIEIERANLTDWKEEPEILSKLKSEELKNFFKAVNSIWLDLYKKFDSNTLYPGCVSSHLPMKHSFIVPGGRFIEMYYWDTYWTIEGLLVCDMFKTAREMIENFIHFIDLYGFIPNGSRIYYLNRSQPPYFSQIVFKYFEYTQNSQLLSQDDKLEIKNFVLNEALVYMIKEYEFWMKEKIVEIEIDDHVYRLNIFKANTNRPRPESYFEDINTASGLSSEKEKEILYQHLASGAESGHDFTSRWFRDPMKIHTIETSDIIPVDLNAILYKTELIISKLSYLKGNLDIAKLFKRNSIERRLSINKVLWSEQNKMWTDFNLKTKTSQSEHFYLSNLSPLWFGLRPPNHISELDLINMHIKKPIEEYNGLPYSFVYSNEQWDFPNVWAPYQLSLTEFLHKHDKKLSLQLASKFFNSLFTGWKMNNTFFEKYNALNSGKRGAGGEYEVQSGFGWTNGVALKLIEIFQDKILDY
ncbi:unnamed protein product [Brachionus calyciflorus]|uniref:Trehalase n=1 Tax=Brachionus calyciflorus TaxID=104777 RepID=A0A813M454_9BILA|nr:unnamed protein product [Brachionus calyciflorus]